MVTKQQQLEWLANNLEKWKSGYDYAVVEKAADGYLYVRWPSVCASGITKQEWQQERDKMQKQAEQDNSWHDRSKLPPVGCVVDVTGDYVAYGYGESECDVLAHVEDCAVIRMSFGLGCFVAEALSPSNTKRGKVVDAACQAIGDVIGGRLIIERLYDAGLLK